MKFISYKLEFNAFGFQFAVWLHNDIGAVVLLLFGAKSIYCKLPFEFKVKEQVSFPKLLGTPNIVGKLKHCPI